MPDIANLLKKDTTHVASLRTSAAEALKKVSPSPPEAQIAFLKELVKNPKEAEKFSKDPKQYTVDHGILLDPALVKFVTDSVLFDTVVDPSGAAVLGDAGLKDLIDMRAGIGGSRINPGTVANAAAVAAGAAVVMAAVAVVTMVVTLVRTQRPQDLVSLQGLGAKGVTLPGGNKFIAGGPVAAGRIR
ncbi:hypothetical protein BE11_15545 [Sorangium cellulosum]|nr:hypothetical protein BE11_15545 [Sorangium cellulosum]